MFRHETQLRRNILSGPAMRIVNTGIVLVSYPVYLRSLGFERYGLWLVLSTVLMFSQIGNLGITQSIAKVAAEEHARGNMLGVRQYATAALVLLLCSGAALVGIAHAWPGGIASLLGLEGEMLRTATRLLPWVAALSVYVFIVDVQTNLLSGLGRADLVNYLQGLAQFVTLAVAVVLLRRGGGVESLLIANAAGRAAQHGSALLLAWRECASPPFTTAPLSASRLRSFTRLSASLFGSTAINMMLSPLNRLVLAHWAGVQTVPIYEIAFNGTMQIRSLLASTSTALMPEISRLGAVLTDASRAAIVRLNRRAVRLLAASALPLYAGIYLTIDVLLRVWLRGEVRPGQTAAFRIMLAGTFVSLLATVPYCSLLGLGLGRKVLGCYAIQSSVNVAAIAAARIVRGGITLPAVLTATSLGMASCAVYLFASNARALASLRAESGEGARPAEALFSTSS